MTAADSRGPTGATSLRDRRPPVREVGAGEAVGSTSHMPNWLPTGVPWPLLIAAGAGAMALLLVLSVAGLVGGRDRAGTLEARMARAEQRLAELSARPAVSAVEATTRNDPALLGRFGLI